MANANGGWKPRALTNSFSPGMCVAHRGDVDGAAGVARRDVHGRAGARAGDAAGAAVRGAAASSEARQELEQIIGADGSVAVDVGGAAGGLLGRDLWVPGGRRGLAGRGTHAGFGAGARGACRPRPANPEEIAGHSNLDRRWRRQWRGAREAAREGHQVGSHDQDGGEHRAQHRGGAAVGPR